MKRTIYTIAFMAAALCCLASCDDEAHEDEIGVAVAIGWQDADDKDTEVDDIRLWMYNANTTSNLMQQSK